MLSTLTKLFSKPESKAKRFSSIYQNLDIMDLLYHPENYPNYGEYDGDENGLCTEVGYMLEPNKKEVLIEVSYTVDRKTYYSGEAVTMDTEGVEFIVTYTEGDYFQQFTHKPGTAEGGLIRNAIEVFDKMSGY